MGRLSAEQINGILARSKGARPQVWVETGCADGKQLVVAAPLFSRVFGVELDAHHAEAANKAVSAAPHVVVIHGDTQKELPKLAARMNEPVLFYLDAHYCAMKPPIRKSPFPLWDELILLRQRPFADIVIVDDVHTFGKRRDDLRYKDAPEWEGVTGASLSSFLGVPGETIGDGWVMWLPDRQQVATPAGSV